MTDNVAVTPGSGANIATDDIGGVQFQRVKLIHGANGVNDGDVSTANGLPVNVIAGSAAGVQYTEGDIDSTITGTAMLWEDTGDTLTTVSSVTPLPVNITTASNPIGTYSTIGVDDAVFNGGDALWGIGAVRDDALTTLIEVDGDWNPLRTNARGAAWVAIEDGSGGQITSFGGGTQYTEGDIDASITGTAMLWEDTSDTLRAVSAAKPLPVQGTVATTQSGTWTLGANSGVDIGDVTINNAAGAAAVNIQDGGNTITVDGTVAATQSGTWNVGTVTTLTSITNAVTVSQATASSLNAQVVGTVAHDTGDSGNPIKIGGKARTTNPTAVANADRVDATFDDIGRQVVVVGQVRDLITDATTTIASSSSETTILAQAASTFHDLTLLVLTNATATACSATIKDGTGGTTRMIVDLAANGGAVIPFPRPLKAAANNTNWTCTLSSAAVTVHIFAQAEKNV